MSSRLGRPLPGSVAWAAERIRRIVEREEQERLARRRASQGAARTGTRAANAAHDPTPITGGLLDPRLWTDEYYRAQQNRPVPFPEPPHGPSTAVPMPVRPHDPRTPSLLERLLTLPPPYGPSDNRVRRPDPDLDIALRARSDTAGPAARPLYLPG